MGAAAAELVRDLGGEVIVMDFADVTLSGVKGIKLDLRDKASIDAALDECGGPIHALLSCAGAADGTPGIEKINFIGHRYQIDLLLDRGMLGRGAANGFITSAAGLVWEVNLPQLTEERRKEYIKLARAKAEDAKISIRNIRRKAKEEIDHLVKDGKVGEDEGARAEKELESSTKKHVDYVDASLKVKEAELLEV